jgi:hypothetical protein
MGPPPAFVGVESAPQEYPSTAKNQTRNRWIFTVVLVLTAWFQFSGLAQAKAGLVGTW